MTVGSIKVLQRQPNLQDMRVKSILVRYVRTGILIHMDRSHFSKILCIFYFYWLLLDISWLIHVFHERICTWNHSYKTQVQNMFYRVMFCVLRDWFLEQVMEKRFLIIYLKNYRLKLNNIMKIVSNFAWAFRIC